MCVVKTQLKIGQPNFFFYFMFLNSPLKRLSISDIFFIASRFFAFFSCENDNATPITMLSSKSTSVKGYILLDFGLKNIQHELMCHAGEVKAWILADDSTDV